MSLSEQTVTLRLGVLRPDSIRSKILLFAVFATLLPSLTTAWFSYLENKSSLMAKASEEVLNVSAQSAREIDLWTKERRYDLRVFASSYEVTENVDQIQRRSSTAVRSGRAYQRLTDYLNSVRERFADYAELLILDANGGVVASSGEPPEAVELPADWRTRLRNEALMLGPPYWDATNNRPEMLIAVPIGIGEQFLGAITAKVDLQTLSNTLKRFAPGETGRVYLLGEDGGLIVGSGEGSAALMELRYDRSTIAPQVASEGRPAEFTNITGEQVIGSMRQVPGLDWVVVAEIPSAEVFAQLARLRNITLLIVAAMLTAAAALGYALGMFIVRPLNGLTRGAAKVAAGDLDVDLPVAMGGEVGYLTEVFNNMVARLRAGRSELERLSVTDPLTGLSNRRRMVEALQNEVLRSRRLNHTFAVLMADVDHFKEYNDAHGHPAGDEVLRRVAAALREATRDVDSIARYGGEEFFVLMPETGARGAAVVAERVRQLLAADPLTANAVTLSFGVAEFPVHGDTGEALIAVADATLYQAKRAGRDQVIVAPVPERARVARG